MDMIGFSVPIAILILVVAQEARTQDSFYFDPYPQDTDVIEGDSVLLRCDVSNRHHIVFKWEQNGKRVTNTSRRYMDDSDLRIARADRKLDSGVFHCIATNVTTRIPARSAGAELNILWIDKTAEVELKTPRETSDVTMGEELQLRCVCEGNPEPDVEWYRNGLRVSESVAVRTHKNRLRLAEVTPADNGIYACAAQNEAGRIESMDTNFLLSVTGEGAAMLNTDTFTKLALVRRGEAATFNCEFANVMLTEWFYQDRLLNNATDGDKFMTLANGSLVINDVRNRDVGGYTCVGHSQSGPAQSFIAELVLAYLGELTPESFEPRPPTDGPVVIPVGGEHHVTCARPGGLPDPTLRWLFTSIYGDPPAEVSTNTDDRIHVADDTLHVTDARDTDGGNYTCLVENMAGEQRKDIWLMISIAPVLESGPISERLYEGEVVTFSCTYTGTPFPVTEVTWLKEEKSLDRNVERFDIDKKLGILTISDIRPSDEGNYACVVNSTGHQPITSLNARLYVMKKLKFRPAPHDTKLELGSSARIRCEADGQASPRVYWRKDGAEELGAGVEDNGGVLEFAAVTYEHAGAYTCEALSEQGHINKTIRVEVVVKPWIKVLPQNTTAYEGYAVMLHCVAEGMPRPTVKWDKNGQVQDIDANQRFQTLSNGSLLIGEAYMEDLGKYGCTAGSSAGFSRAEMYLSIASGQPVTRTRDMERFDMMKTIIIAVCAAVAYLAVVIGLTVYCSIRLVKRKAEKNKRNAPEDALPNGHTKGENGHVATENTQLMEGRDQDLSVIKPMLSDDTRSHASAVSSHNSSHPSSSMRSASTYHKYHFPRNSLETLGLLGKCQFGDVFLAKAHQIHNGETETLVVVKSLLSRDERGHFEFRREMDMLSRLNHEHVVKLLGVCREMEPQFLITEYPEWGDLKQFLWAMRKDNSVNLHLKVPPLNHAQKVAICNQVAMGMEHLANHRLVHKDLASRNVLLQPNLDVKISNLGLCLDVYASEYYPLSHNYLIPLRWMAPETVYSADDFSTKSDVWAFGCFIYEVFSLGDVPYRHRTDEEVLTGLKTGDCVLDEIPAECPPELWDLVHKCTADSALDRPTFSELCVALAQMTVDSDV